LQKGCGIFPRLALVQFCAHRKNIEEVKREDGGVEIQAISEDHDRQAILWESPDISFLEE
jgi:hypothetical protein